MSLNLVDLAANIDGELLEDIDAFIRDMRAGIATLIATRPGTTFRDNIFVSRSGRLIFKTYRVKDRKPVERIRAKWKIPSKKFGHRFGWAEWLNSRQAMESGVSLAAPVAYLEEVATLFCSLQVVAFEKLNGHKTMLDLMSENGPTTELLNSVEKSLWSLSSSAVFHIDLNCRNILIADAPSEQNKIIDWEYACFNRKKLIDLYCYYLGYLYFGGVKKFMPEQDYDSWALNASRERHWNSKTSQPNVLDNEYYIGAKNNIYPRDLRYALFI